MFSSCREAKEKSWEVISQQVFNKITKTLQEGGSFCQVNLAGLLQPASFQSQNAESNYLTRS